MPKRVQLPDGTTGEFPDTMSDDDIGRVLRKQFPPPLPEGVKQVGTNSAGGRMIAPEGVSSWDVFKQDIQDPEAWKNAGAAAWSELKSVPQGVASLFAPPESTGGKTALALTGPAGMAALAAKRLAGSELQSRGKLTSQAADQFKAGHPVLGTASTVLAGLPIPGVAGMGAGVNDSMDSGDVSGGIGKGLADVGMLAVPEAARRLSPILAKGRESLRQGIQSMVGAGDKPVRAEVAAKAESAGKTAKSTEEGNRAEITKHDKAVTEAGQKDVNAHVQYLADKAEADQANAAAKAIPDSRAGLESLANEKTEQADILTEKARKDSLKEGNEKYNGVNHALDHIEADPETTKSILLNAVESLSDQRGKMPPLIKDLDDRLNGRTPGGDQRGPMNYDELQGFYSKLGNALSGRSLESEAYHAYDITHDAIGKEMQRIADSKGMGQELTAAREFWRRMKQTFGKSSDTINDRAGKAVNDASPEYTEAQREEYRNRLLGSFNPEIPKLLEAAKSAQERLKALGSDSTRPTAKAPDYPKPTEVAPPKTNPIKVPDVNTRDIREEFVRRWAHGEEKLNPFQVRSLIRGGLGPVIGAVIGEHFGGMGAAAGAIAGTALGPAMVAKLVDMAPVREWLTRPPAGELETFQSLPYADRIKITDGLKKVVSQAQKQGIKVSPSLLAAIGYSAHPTPPALKGSPLDEQQ